MAVAAAKDPARTARDERLEALLYATARGDRRAFADLYAETASRLYGVALRIAGRSDHAEDALQEAFVRVWDRAGDFRADRGSPLAWLCTIVRHKAIDRRRRETVSVTLDEAHEQQPATDPVLSDETRRLRSCLEALGEPQRSCIVMAFVEGYTHQELATRLDRPLGTIKSWIRRSLGQLKLCLDR